MPHARSHLLHIIGRDSPPLPWAEGECIPWNDPEFSARMLREHLSQEHDLASRRAAIIDAQTRWLHTEVLGGQKRAHVLDLACGPGLYLHRLALLGHSGVGVDFSPASIDHARDIASLEDLDLELILADLRDAPALPPRAFDLAILLYGQLNVFRPDDARQILERAHDALRPGGHLVIEPQTRDAVRADGEHTSSWSTADGGLFMDAPHLILYERFWDAPTRTATERWFVVAAETGTVTRYAQSMQAYDDDALRALLTGAGFVEIEHLPALPGCPEDGPLTAFIATRAAA